MKFNDFLHQFYKMPKFPWHFVKFPDISLTLRNFVSPWHFPDGYEPCPSIWVRARTQSKQVNWCFRVYTDPSPCPKIFVSDLRSSSLHVAIFSDADVRVFRGCAMRMPNAACSCGRYCRLPKCPWPRMTSDPSLWCSVNKTLSGAWTRTRARLLARTV